MPTTTPTATRCGAREGRATATRRRATATREDYPRRRREAPRGRATGRRRGAIARATETTATTSTIGRAETTRYDDADIPRGVGSATKAELAAWLAARRLPRQKMALEVNLAEGRGLVATEEIKRGEAVARGRYRATLITVERAIAEAKLGPKHAEVAGVERAGDVSGAAGAGVGERDGGRRSGSTSGRCLDARGAC